jgi:hypothetical protein
VVDQSAAARIVVIDRLGAVAVGVEEECAVVRRRVFGARAGLAIALVAGGSSDAPELVDECARRRDEPDMQSARRIGILEDEQFVVAPRRPAVPVMFRDAERRQNELVEALRRLAVGCANRDVIEQAVELSGSSASRSRLRP